MADDIITYETLYEILRREKYNQELQTLDKEFFKNTTTYLNEKESILESQKQKSSIFSATEINKTKKQIENIKKYRKFKRRMTLNLS